MTEAHFSWPYYPKSEAEFEALMQAVDKTLTKRGLAPFQRPLHVGRLFWDAFQWSGKAFPAKELAGLPGYSGDILRAKAYQWYESTYGEQLNRPGSIGHFPVQLGNTVWKALVPIVYGSVTFFMDRNLENVGANVGTESKPASVNLLRLVDKLPQGMALRLPDSQLLDFFSLFQLAAKGLMWRNSLPRSSLLHTSRDDHEASTEDIVGGRFGQARWAAQQAVEKTMKGLLELNGSNYPTGGPNGHNLRHLSGLMKSAFSTDIPDGLLSLAECSPAVRYGEVSSSQVQAVQANHSVLGMLEILSRCKGLQLALANKAAAPARPTAP